MNDTTQRSTSGDGLGKDYEIGVTPVAPDRNADATLYRFWLQSVARALAPKERVKMCLRHIAPMKSSAHIVRSPSRQKASFRNLLTCGSIHICPVCAAKISERRAQELLAAVTHWHQRHGKVLLVTYTLRHNREQPLSDVLDTLQNALRRYKAGKGFQTIAAQYGIAGTIRALETTHGQTAGWHPHVHELVFIHAGYGGIGGFQAAARRRWLDSVTAVGGDALIDVGIDVQIAESEIYSYVAKYGRTPKNTRWTVEREVAKGASKTASRGGRQPLQLLDAAGNGDAAAGYLWTEYITVMRGKRQLVWSRDLRALLKMEMEESDSAIAKSVEDDAVLLAVIDADQWRALMRLPRDVRGELLNVAHEGDREKLRAWLLVRHIVLTTTEGTDNGTDERTINHQR